MTSRIMIDLPDNGRDVLEDACDDAELSPNLTPKQERFVEAYMGPAKGNATEAARMAGYRGNENTLRSIGGENLRKPPIADAIRRLTEEFRSEAIATIDEVKALLSAIARDETLEPGVRISAADKLLRAGGAYLERREVTHLEPSVRIYLPERGQFDRNQA
jgi:phage terminase small subunit